MLLGYRSRQLVQEVLPLVADLLVNLCHDKALPLPPLSSWCFPFQASLFHPQPCQAIFEMLVMLYHIAVRKYSETLQAYIYAYSVSLRAFLPCRARPAVLDQDGDEVPPRGCPGDCGLPNLAFELPISQPASYLFARRDHIFSGPWPGLHCLRNCHFMLFFGFKISV